MIAVNLSFSFRTPSISWLKRSGCKVSVTRREAAEIDGGRKDCHSVLSSPNLMPSASRIVVPRSGPPHGRAWGEETKGVSRETTNRVTDQRGGIWILQITVYYKELLTINCQGTNHPRSILSFMDISFIIFVPAPLPGVFRSLRSSVLSIHRVAGRRPSADGREWNE